jgi:cellulose synthase/poly-beta-1,6-N-acetylglucosamine synthase-like glycosyltransferase
VTRRGGAAACRRPRVSVIDAGRRLPSDVWALRLVIALVTTVVAHALVAARRAAATPVPVGPRPEDCADDARTAPPWAAALTVIVPAYNEAEFVGATVRSILRQTRPPEVLVVVDDGSTDDTAEVARAAGSDVIRPPANTGSKAGAQNFALTQVGTEFVMAIDADTTLADDAIERLLPALDDARVAAACGYVLPRRVKSICERGRYIEYLFAFAFGKQIQDYFSKPLISSGCFSVYRTAMLRGAGGWPTRTLAEDMDLTWTLYRRGRAVRFVPSAVCYPIEPETFGLMGKQLRRWSHGFLQNVRIHWRGLMRFGYLRVLLAVALWDSIVASLAYIVVFPALAVLVSPWFLLGYLVDAPAVLVPALAGALPRRELLRALASYPSCYVLRLFNAAIMLRAVWSEFVLRRSLLVYEKGH